MLSLPLPKTDARTRLPEPSAPTSTGVSKVARSVRTRTEPSGLLDVPHPALIDDFEAGVFRRARQPRIELIAPDDGAERVAAKHFDLADLGARGAAHHFDRGNLELEAEFLQREHGFRNQAAGAGLRPRMARLLDRNHAPFEFRMRAQQIQRGGQSGRTGARRSGRRI